MKFDEELEQFVFEYNGLIFAWDEEPVEDYIDQVKTMSEKYNARLDSIIEFMMPDIVAIFGDFSTNEIKEKLGKPVINYENGQVNYLQQSFDDVHIFTFEFMDDEFQDLKYFSMDGWFVTSSLSKNAANFFYFTGISARSLVKWYLFSLVFALMR